MVGWPEGPGVLHRVGRHLVPLLDKIYFTTGTTRKVVITTVIITIATFISTVTSHRP